MIEENGAAVAMPELAKSALQDLYQHLCLLATRVLDYDRRITVLIKNDPRAQRIQRQHG